MQSLKFVDPLNPRDAFTGGRTNAARLLVGTEGTTYKIRYIDITSLYPDINKNGVYPVGHPIILTDNLERLFHAVLPYRCNNKLMFPLCRTCAETQNSNTRVITVPLSAR